MPQRLPSLCPSAASIWGRAGLTGAAVLAMVAAVQTPALASEAALKAGFDTPVWAAASPSAPKPADATVFAAVVIAQDDKPVATGELVSTLGQTAVFSRHIRRTVIDQVDSAPATGQGSDAGPRTGTRSVDIQGGLAIAVRFVSIADGQIHLHLKITATPEPTPLKAQLDGVVVPVVAPAAPDVIERDIISPLGGSSYVAVVSHALQSLTHAASPVFAVKISPKMADGAAHLGTHGTFNAAPSETEAQAAPPPAPAKPAALDRPKPAAKTAKALKTIVVSVTAANDGAPKASPYTPVETSPLPAPGTRQTASAKPTPTAKPEVQTADATEARPAAPNVAPAAPPAPASGGFLSKLASALFGGGAQQRHGRGNDGGFASLSEPSAMNGGPAPAAGATPAMAPGKPSSSPASPLGDAPAQSLAAASAVTFAAAAATPPSPPPPKPRLIDAEPPTSAAALNIAEARDDLVFPPAHPAAAAGLAPPPAPLPPPPKPSLAILVAAASTNIHGSGMTPTAPNAEPPVETSIHLGPAVGEPRLTAAPAFKFDLSDRYAAAGPTSAGGAAALGSPVLATKQNPAPEEAHVAEKRAPNAPPKLHLADVSTPKPRLAGLTPPKLPFSETSSGVWVGGPNGVAATNSFGEPPSTKPAPEVKRVAPAPSEPRLDAQAAPDTTGTLNLAEVRSMPEAAFGGAEPPPGPRPADAPPTSIMPPASGLSAPPPAGAMGALDATELQGGFAAASEKPATKTPPAAVATAAKPALPPPPPPKPRFPVAPVTTDALNAAEMRHLAPPTAVEEPALAQVRAPAPLDPIHLTPPQPRRDAAPTAASVLNAAAQDVPAPTPMPVRLPTASRMIFDMRLYEAHPGDGSIAPSLVYTDGQRTYFDFRRTKLKFTPIVARDVQGAEDVVQLLPVAGVVDVFYVDGLSNFVLHQDAKTVFVKRLGPDGRPLP